MENPSSFEQNLNVLSRLMVDLKHTKDQVAIRGNWNMVAWLKNVGVTELQVDKIKKEFMEKTADFSLKDLHTKDVLYSKLMEIIAAVNVLIEDGNAGSKSIPVQLSSPEKNQLKLFSSEDLKKFIDSDKILGSGGFSDVYEGEFEGEQVAVKVLKENAGMVYETFLTERFTMGKIFHKNIVKLRGFCFDDHIKALVYEYMENGSLDKILYKNPNSVEWERLYDIALGIARGLAYLHHDCSEQVIHHDVKAANVLLDENFSAKITDFGVSNLMKSDVTHLTNTRIRGTNYYMAPEINQPPFWITCRCDVYSFGIMMFEILGRRRSIPKAKIWFPHEVSEMFNKQPETVMGYCGIMEKDSKKAMIVLMVAMWCVQNTPTIRPSMRDVVLVLEKELSVTTPPYPFHHHIPLGHSMLSDDDLNKFAQEALLELYKEKCPPGGENSVVIYTTTIGRMRRTFRESNELRAILQSYQIKMIERDVWGEDVDYEDELNDLLGKKQNPPVLFVKGRLIGGADEVVRLEAEGKLKVLLYGIPTEYSEAKKSPLQLFKEMCPPGGENTVVLYTTTIDTTTIGKMKRRFEESNEIRAILQSHDIVMIERDVGGDDVDYEDELVHLLGKIQIPVLFVKGRLIGAADEVKRLEAEGKLKVLFYDEAKISSEWMLELFEEKCPPGGENSVIIYTSTIQEIERLFEESNDVRAILQSHQIKMIERDVWGDDVDYYNELYNVMGKIQIPVLFVKGRLIGGADEVNRLETEGKLNVLLYGIPTEE